jgi:hypothetical protein
MSRRDHYPRWRGGSVIEADARSHRLRDNDAMIARAARYGCAGFLAGLWSAASANCESGSFPLFGCDAAKSRKFIELCAPSPLDAKSGFLRYRFGSLDTDGNEQVVKVLPGDQCTQIAASSQPDLRSARLLEVVGCARPSHFGRDPAWLDGVGEHVRPTSSHGKRQQYVV